MPTVQVDLTPVETDTNTYGFDERDVKYLGDRAVSLKLAHDEGLRSVTELELREGLARDYHIDPDVPSGGLWIPYSTTEGDNSRVSRLRFWQPSDRKKKFTSSAVPAIPYIAKLLLKDSSLKDKSIEELLANAELSGSIAQDVTVPLFFAEGPIKALALITAGLMAVGLGGVESGFFDKAHKDATKEYILHALLKLHIRLDCRLVYVVYDAGRVSNPCVVRGEGNLARVLRAAGAHVKLVELPLDENGKDQGPDDYLAKHGKDAFHQLVDAAIEADPVMRASACSTKEEALLLLNDLPFLGALHVGGADIRGTVKENWKARLDIEDGDFDGAVEGFASLIQRHMENHPRDDKRALEDRSADTVPAERRRPSITIQNDTHRTVVEALRALKSVDGIYCRAGELVSIYHIDGHSYSIWPIELSVLVTVYLSKAAKWQRRDARTKKMIGTKPPMDVGRAIMDMKHWGAAIRVLRGITTVPLMRPDGSILQQRGYDVGTKLIYAPCVNVPEVPEHPTLEDARQAAEELLDLLHDFPIAGSGHSTWLAGLLTHFGREMFKGPTPAIVFGANSPRIGKTLLAKMANAICEGTNIACRSYPDNEEEIRKTVLSILTGTSRMVLFDNWSQSHAFGDSVIDALLTSDVYSGRKLGVIEDMGLPNRNLWMISGVNPEVRGDTAARVIYCNIYTDDPHPELRDPKQFKYPRVEQYCHDHRGKLIRAVLTILRAWVEAGKPAPTLSIGSFESWATVVCGAIEWLGMPSPILTQEECAQEQGLAGGLNPTWVFLDEWKQQYPSGAYCIDVVQSLQEEDLKYQARLREAAKTNSDPAAHKYARLRAAITEFCPGRNGGLPTVKYLGQRMGRIKGRNIEGHILRGVSVNHTSFWSVVGLKESAKHPTGHGLEATGIEPASAGIDRGLNSKSIPVNNHPEFIGDLCAPYDETGIEGIESLTLTQEEGSEVVPSPCPSTAGDMSIGDGESAFQSPQSPNTVNLRSGIESGQSPSMGQSPPDPFCGVAVSVEGYADKFVILLQSESGKRFLRRIPRCFPHIASHLTAMGFESVPADGEEIKVCTPRRLLWDCLDADRGLAGFVEVVAA